MATRSNFVPESTLKVEDQSNYFYYETCAQTKKHIVVKSIHSYRSTPSLKQKQSSHCVHKLQHRLPHNTSRLTPYCLLTILNLQ